MADHRAEQLIAAIVTRVTNLSTTGSRVYRGRIYALQSTELPALLVYMGDDQLRSMYSQTLVDSLLAVKIEARVKSPTAQLDTTLNLIRKEVTIALQADITQGLAFVIDTAELGADEPQFSKDGDQPVGSQVMAWQFLYRRSRTDPSA